MRIATGKEGPELHLLQRTSSLVTSLRNCSPNKCFTESQIHLNINYSEETAWIRTSWSNCCKETTTKGHQWWEETWLGKETQAIDIRPVEICPLVWWVQIWDVWFQPPCLINKTPGRWKDNLCKCGSHREARRRRYDGVCDLFRFQGTLNQHGYNSILQQYASPSGVRLVGL